MIIGSAYWLRTMVGEGASRTPQRMLLKYNDFLVHFLGQVNQGYPYENVEMKNGSNERLLPEL